METQGEGMIFHLFFFLLIHSNLLSLTIFMHVQKSVQMKLIRANEEISSQTSSHDEKNMQRHETIFNYLTLTKVLIYETIEGTHFHFLNHLKIKFLNKPFFFKLCHIYQPADLGNHKKENMISRGSEPASRFGGETILI